MNIRHPTGLPPHCLDTVESWHTVTQETAPALPQTYSAIQSATNSSARTGAEHATR